MNGRKLSVNKACLFLAVLLLVAMGTVSAALYGLTQNITAVWYVVLFGIFVLLCAVCFMVLVRRKLAMFSDSFCSLIDNMFLLLRLHAIRRQIQGVTEIIRAIEQNYLGWHEIIFLETLKALSLLLRPYF